MTIINLECNYNMNLITKRLLTALLTAILLLGLVACDNDASDDNAVDSDNAAVTDETSELEKELRVFFDDLYACFNEQRYEDYVQKLNVIDENVRANMLNSFKTGSQYNTTTCIIEKLEAKQFEDGLINAALSLITTTVSKDENTTPYKIREIVYFNLTEADGVFTVKNYMSGGSELVTEATAAPVQ